MLRHGFATIKCGLKTPTIVAAWRYPNIYGTLRMRKPIMKLWPRPHYIVLKRKPYCFVPFSKRFASTLRFRIVFALFTLQRVSVLKTLLNRIFFYIIPPFFLYYFPCNKLKLSHYAEVRPGLVPNHLGFSGLRPSHFYYHRSTQSLQTKKRYKSRSLLKKSKSSLDTFKCAFKSVKRLKLTARKEARKPPESLSAILDTRGWVVFSKVVVLWWRIRFQIP